MLTLTRTPIVMSSTFDRKSIEKRAKKDVQKLNKGFDKINKDSKIRGKEASDSLKSFFENLDKIARKDVDKVKTIFDDIPVDVTLDSEDYNEIDDIIVFKENKNED